MFVTLWNLLRRLCCSEPVCDPRREYRFRCVGCYDVSGEKLHPPETEAGRIVIISCAKCGTENRMTIPFAPQEVQADGVGDN